MLIAPDANAQQGQSGQGQKIQLRLTNTTGQGVDAYYVRPDTGAPEYVKSISPGQTIDMSSIQGMVWLFAIQRRQFQSYTTRSEPFQGLDLAPAGQQRPPQLAMDYQPPGGQIQPARPQTPVLAQRPSGPAQPPAQTPLQTLRQPQAPGGIPAYAPASPPPENRRPPAENAAFGPSFSCRGGGLTPTEGRLCNNEALGSLDREIVDVYRWVKSQLGAAGQTDMEKNQRRWLQQRNLCGQRDDCLTRAYLDRREYLNKFSASGQTASLASTGGAGSFPHPAMSWGGKVRSGPGIKFRRIAGLKQGDRISILEQSNSAFYQDMPWFKIRFRGRIGYHWGGVICPIGRAVSGTYKVC